MGINVAYGERGRVAGAISTGLIPNDTLIITSDKDDSELLFLNSTGCLKPLAERTRFNSMEDALDWVSKYPCSGFILTVKAGDGWDPYTVNDDGTLSRLDVVQTVIADNHSIINSDSGLSLYGFTEAKPDTIPAKDVDGSLKWIKAPALPSVTIGGIPLPISGGVLAIPFASGDTPGVVVGSADRDKIAVELDGSLSVNSISINKIVQDEGDTLFLNGGTSSV